MQDFVLNGHPIASIVDCCRQNITNLTCWVSRRAETATAQLPTTRGGDKVRIRSNELSDLNSQELAKFVHLIRAGAPT